MNKNEQAKDEATKKPTRDDVHEQREPGQKSEAVVKEGKRGPAQSEIDLDRASGEGMGAPSTDEDPSRAALPTPGANSLAGQNQKKS